MLNLLYIEDDPLDRMAVERMIRKQHAAFNLFLTQSVEETKQLIQEKKAVFDVIITDYLLKDGNAFDVFELNYPAPIIFITGAGNEEVAVKAMKMGAYDYIIKDSARNYLKILPITIQNTLTNYQSKNRLQLLESSVLNAHDAILIAKANTSQPTQSNTIFQNEAFTQLTGYTLEQLQGQNLGLLLGEQTDLQEVKRINEGLKSGEGVHTEIAIYSKTQQLIWLDIMIVPIFDKKSHHCTHYVSIARDITRKKQSEVELLKAKSTAEEAKKAEEHFLAVMSHEIRTPMNAIVGLINLMQDTPINAEQTEYVKAIKNSADNLLALVNDILDLSKIERGKIEFNNTPFDIEQLIKNSVKSLKYISSHKKIDLLLSNDINLPKYVKGDALRINQVITNLLGNAIKFTEKGEISIKTKVLQQTKHKIILNIQVTDSGIGISPDKVEAIFNKYQQADKATMIKYGGSGLGLFIVEQLVKLQGGAIEVMSEEGKGSTFSVTLPFELVVDHQQLISPFDQKNNLRGKRILVGEDNLMNKKIVKKMLEKWDAIVEEADNGQEVVEYLVSDNYDALLVDIQMPVMDGIQTIHFIRNRLKNKIPIIVMTASAFNNKHDIINENIDGFIQKPFDPNNLFNLLYKCVQKSSCSSKINGHNTLSASIDNYYDLSYLRKISSNNTQFIKEMINIFILQAEEVTAVLPTYLIQKNYMDIGKLAHKIKSSARNIGNQTLSNSCQEIENIALHTPKDAELPSLIDLFLVEVNQTKQHLLAELQQINTNIPSSRLVDQ